MPDYFLSPATAKNKRYKIETPEGKVIQFGASAPSEAFIDHKSEAKKKAWIARHKKGNPDAWRDKNSPLFWARNLLWNKPTLSASIRAIRSKYGYHVKVNSRD